MKLPKKNGTDKLDVSDFFGKEGKAKEEFLDLVDTAQSALVDTGSVKHISEYNDELRNMLLGGSYTGISTGYDALDAIM